MKKLIIDRYSGIDEISRETWKDLISALVLVGYEVYGDEDKIIIKLGNDDVIEEEENNE